ncbi:MULTISPECIES: mechanosensitive ion channel family protein [unclassified Luteimonas]|uniref:mechanosensitive ion channel family protein n=1 Tax=unclassified Luteimonas TaxID=2629088 RepID=UPI001600D03E|nr:MULTISPECIES: mechanosensitive ion channel family protein [unclassified Luteimonas]MBB1471751.1 mechanosensitive ion channel [Luteimonas sp. MC1782]MBB6599506.1 mechanosensitive ion channel [Luteimonas sp. MC1825]QOC87204.1 mechanosensitive ion channel [Luteimonas sp. MC1825]
MHARPALSSFAASLVLAFLFAIAAGQPARAQAASAPDPTAVTPDASADLAASRRLAQSLREVDGLQDVTVTVRGGVARLQGDVIDIEDRSLAEQVAGQQDGITAVDNQLALSTRLSDRFDTATQLAVDKLMRLVAALPLLVVAIAVVMLSWWLGKLVGARIGRRQWRSDNPYFASLLQRLAQWLTLLGGLLVALDLLGASALVGAVLGSAGVVGLVLGFAFKDIAENYVAGILLSLRRPFVPGDLLRIDSYEGKVAALTSRATVLVTLDGNRLTLPNALVFKSVVLNYTRNARRRIDFTIPVDGGESIRQAQQVAMGALCAVTGVLDDPSPSWTVAEYDASGLTLRFFAWVDQRQADPGKVRSEALHVVRTALAEAGIEAPRAVHYVAPLPQAAMPAAAEAVGPPADTSVNRDIDAQVAAEQRAHADEDLITDERAAAT